MYRKYFIHIVLAVTFVSQGIQAQTLITLEKALEIAGSNSPEIQKSYLNMERYRESLNAQRAAYKSKFQLNVTPFSYESNRSFNTFFSQWNNEETTQSYGVFSVSQPILHTDATISLNNRFGWQNNYSEFKDTTTTSFTNNLYLQVTQPLFTYNKAKMQLRELELDYENSNLSYSIQMLNLERSVSQYFYQVYMAQMSVTIARDELDKTQQSYEIIKNKVDAGLAAVEQFYQAELNLMNAKSTLQNREVELENTKDEFKLYIGMPLSEPIATLTDISVNPVNVNLENAVSYALAAGWSCGNARLTWSTRITSSLSRETNDFNGDVTLSLGFSATTRSRPMFTRTPPEPQVAVSLTSHFRLGAAEIDHPGQEAMVKSSEINLDNEKKQIEMNIRKIYRSLQNQLTR
jgi:outer membrane protein TolC